MPSAPCSIRTDRSWKSRQLRWPKRRATIRDGSIDERVTVAFPTVALKLFERICELSWRIRSRNGQLTLAVTPVYLLGWPGTAQDPIVKAMDVVDVTVVEFGLVRNLRKLLLWKSSVLGLLNDIWHRHWPFSTSVRATKQTKQTKNVAGWTMGISTKA